VNPRVATLYDSGTAQPLEDRFVVAAPFFAVFDGVSGIYHPDRGWTDYGGKSGGQHVVDIAEEEIRKASSTDSVRTVMERINGAVRLFVERSGLSYDEIEHVPGAPFALAKVGEDSVELIQGGDALAVWRTKIGRIGATANQNYAFETNLLAFLNPLIEREHGDRKAIWEHYIPFLSNERRLHANGPAPDDYVYLNGDPRGPGVWQEFEFEAGELDRLILFTDGIVDFPETPDTDALAHLILSTYDAGGVDALLARIRAIESKEVGKRHINHAEATIIALEFD
jgi:hypothetical protein